MFFDEVIGLGKDYDCDPNENACPAVPIEFYHSEFKHDPHGIYCSYWDVPIDGWGI